MKENVSGCFFSEHSVVTVHRLHQEAVLIEGRLWCSCSSKYRT